MLSFEEYSYLKKFEPHINEAARLISEHDLDPEEYIFQLLEDWPGARRNFGSAWGHAGSAFGDTLQGLGHSIHGMYHSGAAKGSVDRAKQLGRGARSVWRQLFGTEAKMQKAAAILQKVVLDQRLATTNNPTGGGTVLDLIQKIIGELNVASNALKGVPHP